MNPDSSNEATVPTANEAADLDATIRVDVRATLPPGLEQPGDMIGRYKLIEPLGEGGFGSVWRAEQFEPIHREVALKVIKAGMDSREIIARFEAERQALAMMDHPNIAAVLDAGTTENSRPFFAMELVKGMPLTEFCDARKLTICQRLELFIPVCQAVQHAHQKAILHRDLKPSNILVVEVDGKAVPKVIDFGIAKALGGAEEQAFQASLARTQAGMIIGTPQYMSPEQAGAEPDLDTRSDIYTLGVILYELLVGDTPLGREQMRKAANDEIMRLVREADAKRPSSRLLPATEAAQAAAHHRQSDTKRLTHILRGDLDWIVLKSLEKDRNRRYETANALALDLQRHLRDEPVSAGPPSAGYRLKKLVRRNKVVFAAAAAVMLALTAGLALALRSESRARTEARRSDDMLVKMQLQRAEELLTANDTTGMAYLAAVLQRRPNDSLTATRLLSSLRDRSHLQLHVPPLKHAAMAAIAGWDDDSKKLFTICEGVFHKWDAQTGKLLLEIKSGPAAFTFSSDMKRLATFSNSTAKVWDTASGELMLTTARVESAWPGSEHGFHVAYSPDGRFLAVITAAYPVAILDAHSGQLVAAITAEEKPLPTGIAFSPDSHVLAITYHTGLVSFHEASTGKTMKKWKARSDSSLDLPALSTFKSGHKLAFHPAFALKGEALVCRTNLPFGSDMAFVLDWKGPEVRHKTINFGSYISSMGLMPDGETLIMMTGQMVSFWSVSSGSLIRRQDAGEAVTGGSFSRHAPRIAVFSNQRTQVWTSGFNEIARTRTYDSRVNQIRLSPDGSLLAVALASGDIHLWQVDGTKALPLILPVSSSQPVAFHPHAGRAAVLEDSSQDIRVWDLRSGSTKHPPIQTNERTWALIFDASGKRLWSGGEKSVPKEWDWTTAELLRTGARTINFIRNFGRSEDGIRMFAFAETHPVTFHPDTPHQTKRISTYTWGNISPDGRLTLGLSEDQRNCHVWDVDADKPLSQPCRHPNAISEVAADHAHRRFATAGRDGLVRVWEIPTGRPLTSFLKHPSAVNGLSFSPDGTLLATASEDQMIRLWNIATGEAVSETMRHQGVAYSAAFSPDGTRIASTSHDGAVRIWHSPSGRPLSEPLEMCAGYNSACEWREGGNRLITHGWNIPHQWDTPAVDGPVPDWLAAWAEAVAGWRLDGNGNPVAVPVEVMEQFSRLAQVTRAGDVFSRTLRWFYTPPSSRPLSPDGTITRSELIANLCRERSPAWNELAFSLDTSDVGLWANVVFRAINQQEPPSLQKVEEMIQQMEHFSNNEKPLVLRAKAAVLGWQGRLTEAVAACEQALRLVKGKDAATLEQMAHLHFKVGHPDKAAKAAQQALQQAQSDTAYNVIDRPSLKVMLRDSLRAAGRLTEAGEANLDLLGIQERRPANATADLIDLSPYFNGQMDYFAAVPRGIHEFVGVSFDVRGLIRLRARSKEFGAAPSKRPPDLEKPDSVNGIGIQAPCRRLHFLHTAESVYTGAELGAYIVHYADGTTHTIPIQAFTYTKGKVPNIADRNFSVFLSSKGLPLVPPPPLVLAWQGERPSTNPPQKGPAYIWLYLHTWENPRPEVRIESVDFISHGADGGPCLFAITRE